MTGPAEPAPVRPRRRRWPIVLAIVVVLLVAAAVTLDGVARGYASNLIETKLRSALSVPASTPVSATVGGAFVLLQLAQGRLDEVDVRVHGLAVAQLSGDAQLNARGIPIDQSKPIDSVRLQFSVDQTGLGTLLSGFSGVPIDSVAIRSGSVQLGTSFTVLGVKLPVVIAVTPEAVGGELALTPKYFVVAGQRISPSDLSSSLGGFGDPAGFGADLTATQKLCVASRLPKAMRLDSVRVSGDSVVFAVTAKSVVLDQDLLTVKGSCPG